MGKNMLVYTILNIPDLTVIKELFVYFLIAATLILSLVIFFVIYFPKKYKAKSLEETPEQSHGNRRFEIGMTLLATSIVVVFFVLTVKGMQKIQTIPENPKPDLILTGHQWWWEARYTSNGLLTANEIHVPVGKRILLQLNSKDVIHSWWVPEFGRKMDMIPGKDNYLWLYADKPGEYIGACSEFCGDQHGHMRIRVIAQKPQEFKKWQQNQLKPAVSLTDSVFLRGEALFQKKTCSNCHWIKGQGKPQGIGPDLTHFASRKYILADMKVNNRENLKAWINHPDKVKPGARMPDFILSEKDLEAITTYLHHLK